MSTSIGILSADFDSFAPISFLFEQNGFRIININAQHVDLEVLIPNLPEILLLDLNLGNFDGIEICERIREKKNNIIVICSNEIEEYIQIAAFNAGADDFTSKNINPYLLLRKINAMLKRVPKNFSLNSQSIHHLSIKINRESYLVNTGEENISLQKKQFELLFLLVSNPKKVFTRDELYQTVWKSKEVTNPRIIDVHIRKLREKIGENLIITVKGNGYKIAS